MVKIGWFITDEHPSMELLSEIPKSLDILKKTNAGYKYCPATNHYVSNTFLIKSPFSINLNFKNGKLDFVDTSLNAELSKQLIRLDNPSLWHNENRPILQMDLFQGFVADEPVWVEITMPTMDSKTRRLPGRTIPGEFDVYSWQRGLSFAFEWIESDRPLIIEKDDPLYYVRFHSTDPSDKFKIIKIDYTDELNKSRVRCENSKFFYKNNAWKLLNINRLLRPKKFIK